MPFIHVNDIIDQNKLSSLQWSVFVLAPVFSAALNNQQQKAQNILAKITGKPPGSDTTLMLSPSDEKNAAVHPVKMVLTRHLWISCMLWLCCFMSLLVFYLLSSWLPVILKTAGFSTWQFSLAGIFHILAIPTLLAFMALYFKVIREQQHV